MSQLIKLDHIGIRVTNFERSIAFYQQLGFSVVRLDHAERVAVLRHASGVSLNLLDSAEQHHAPLNVLMDAPVKYPGYTHIALEVADISAMADWVTAHGFVITEGPVRFGDGKRSIFFRDPDRNVIELTQLPLPGEAFQTSHNQPEQAVTR